MNWIRLARAVIGAICLSFNNCSWKKGVEWEFGFKVDKSVFDAIYNATLDRIEVTHPLLCSINAAPVA